MLNSVKRSPERLAWTILFVSLFICIALAVGVPTAVLAFYNTATVEANINIKLQSGQTSVRRPTQTDRDPPSVVSLEGYDISEGSSVVLSSDSSGLLTFSEGASTGSTALLTVQLYSNTQLRIVRARLPRFPASRLGDEFMFQLKAGRAQISANSGVRKLDLRVFTDNGSTLITTPGIYSFEQNNDATALNVVAGSAVVTTFNGETSLNLYTGQRTLVSASSVAGGLPPLRNLIKNGRFRAALQPAWKIETLVAQANALSGTVRITDADAAGGDGGLMLERMGDGLGWGRTGVIQPLDARVDGGRELRLALDFAIQFQELPVCAGVGSECPLIVSLTWRDSKEGVREWIQGFYANGTPQIEPGKPTLPDSILTNPQRKHVKTQLGQRIRWETGNLLPYLPDVQTIESVKIYAEGHAVRTQIYSVELLLQD